MHRRAVLAVGWPGGAVDGIGGPLVAHAGPDWRRLLAGPDDEVSGPDGWGAGPVLLRGPSLWRVLPDWLAVLDRAGWSASVLLVARHPGVLADGLSPAASAVLWLRSMLAAERASRSVPRAVLLHDALVAEGQGGLDRAAPGAGLAWVGGGLPDAEPAGPHAASAYAEVWCRHAWAALCRLAASGGREAEAEAALDRVASQFEDALGLFAPGSAPRRLALPSVTLFAADSSRVALTVRAIRQSAGLCAFADAVLLTDAAVDLPGVRIAPIPPLRSRGDYSALMLGGLAGHIHTDHVLIVQWDGFVVDPAAWDPAFLRYDYIGSRWGEFRDGMDVGNGGFSLRSRRLLLALRDPRLVPDPALLEDQQICRGWRPFLEREHGIRFAPPAVADRFGYERIWPAGPAFGFHGLFNLWRHLDDAALVAVAGLLPPDVLRGREFAELTVLCFVYDRLPAFAVLVRLWRDAVGDAAMADAVHRILRDTAAAGRCLDLAFR